MNSTGASIAFNATKLKMDVAAISSSIVGTDFDQINASTAAAAINFTGATLNLSGLSATVSATIDLITTNAGSITATLTISPTLPAYWSITYLADKVQLSYNNPLSVNSKKRF